MMRNCLNTPRFARLILAVVLLAQTHDLFAANSVNLTPINCCDQTIFTTNIAGQTVWRNVSGSSFIGFAVPTNTFTYTSGVPVYLEVVYYDEGDGQIGLQYDSVSGGAYANSLRHVRTSRVDSKTFAKAYY